MTEETNVTTTPMQPVSLPKNKPNDALSILALFGDLTDIGLDPCEELPRVPAPMTKPQAAGFGHWMISAGKKCYLNGLYRLCQRTHATSHRPSATLYKAGALAAM